MSEKDVVITYETLFEMLRIEKNREDLQKLDVAFFDDVLSYLNEKQSSIESVQTQSQLFITDEKDKSRLEFENIKKILKDLYDRREKKIVNIALNRARTGVMLVNTASMLPSEKLLFESISTMLGEFRKSILYKLASGKLPVMDTLQDDVIFKLRSTPFDPTDVITEDSDSNESEDLPSEVPEEPKELKTTPDFSESTGTVKKIRFLTSIEEIVGPDLQIYGPYEEGTVISLPDALSKVLLEKNQAEEIKS